MQIEEFLDFQGDGDIRLKGTRVGIETILFAYLDDKLSAEEIAGDYPAVTLEQIYAAILHYLLYREKMDAYLEAFTSSSRDRQALQDNGALPLVHRLRMASEERHLAASG